MKKQSFVIKTAKNIVKIYWARCSSITYHLACKKKWVVWVDTTQVPDERLGSSWKQGDLAAWTSLTGPSLPTPNPSSQSPVRHPMNRFQSPIPVWGQTMKSHRCWTCRLLRWLCCREMMEMGSSRNSSLVDHRFEIPPWPALSHLLVSLWTVGILQYRSHSSEVHGFLCRLLVRWALLWWLFSPSQYSEAVGFLLLSSAKHCLFHGKTNQRN